LKNQVFVPTAKFRNDIETSWKIQRPLIEAGYEPGLMLVIQGGRRGITDDAETQYERLKDCTESYCDNPIVVMLSNMPIGEMDWLDPRSIALEHALTGVRFAANLPIGGQKMVTFHLNSLTSQTNFVAGTAANWRDYFLTEIAPNLATVARHAKALDVELFIETTPVPEFGDLTKDHPLIYCNCNARALRNPFYLTRHWGFKELRSLGIGICLDLCHSRTIYKMAHSTEAEGVLFPEDIEALKQGSLMKDVQSLLPTDLVHLNDGLGIFTEDGGVFQEGVPLGQGDIAELPEIIQHLNKKKIPFVIEVNDNGDFKNRPGTKTSIEYLLAQKD
jgi:sugar phosphate isomerase/epimerase